MNWAVICSVPKDEDLGKLKEFGKWFTTNVHKYGIQINQIYNFSEEPTCVTRLESGPEGAGDGVASMDVAYENLVKAHPSVSFVIHILPHKNSPEFEKMKHLTCKLSLIGQGVLLDNALNKFSGADEASVFKNVNQYIARRFAQIVDFKHDKRELLMVVRHQVVPLKGRIGRSYHGEDLHSTVVTVLHSDKVVKLAQTQHDSKHFRNSAIICGLPEHFTRYQVAAIFSRWPVASVMLTTRSCAFIDFFGPNAAYQAKAYYDEMSFKDPETGVAYTVTVCPIQSRYLRFHGSDSKEKQRVPFRDSANHTKVADRLSDDSPHGF